jgi:hypothetical protein
MPLYVRTGVAEQNAARIAELDAAPAESLSPEEQKKRADRERKRAERKTEKDKAAKVAEAKKAEEGVATIQEYWKIQRAKLSEEQRAEYEARQEEVLSLMMAMDCYVKDGLEGSGTTQADLDATVQEAEEMAKKYGTIDLIISAPSLRVWTAGEADLRRRIIARGGPNVQFLQYGYFLGLPGSTHSRFTAKFGVKKSSAIEKPYTYIKCEECGFQNTVLWEVLRMYQNRTDGRKFPCMWCQATNAVMPERKGMTEEEVLQKLENWRKSKNQPAPEDRASTTSTVESISTNRRG